MAFLPPWQELTPDYSMESHQRDHENYVACSRGHPRRAKALLDADHRQGRGCGFKPTAAGLFTVRVPAIDKQR